MGGREGGVVVVSVSRWVDGWMGGREGGVVVVIASTPCSLHLWRSFPPSPIPPVSPRPTPPSNQNRPLPPPDHRARPGARGALPRRRLESGRRPPVAPPHTAATVRVCSMLWGRGGRFGLGTIPPPYTKQSQIAACFIPSPPLHHHAYPTPFFPPPLPFSPSFSPLSNKQTNK